nr:hypothetical protein [Pandoravirus belohorizontensis]
MKTATTRTAATTTRSAIAAALVVLAILACMMLSVSAAYTPTGSPTISVGDTFAIFSAYHRSFCHWDAPDPQMLHDFENIKCNVGANDLAQATRFVMTSPYPRQVCGRIPMSPYNISVSFGVKHPECGVPDPLYTCAMIPVIGNAHLINCGANGADNPVEASFLLTNTAAPLNGVDGWLHGGETPVAITSAYTGGTCGVDWAFGKILCPHPLSAGASVFHIIPVDPVPDHEC